VFCHFNMAKRKTNKRAAKRKGRASAKGQLPKPAGVGVPRTAVGQSTAIVRASLAQQVCSISNPFCPEARGARWPDNSHMRSLGYSRVFTQPLATFADGTGGVLIAQGSTALLAFATATIGSGALTFGGGFTAWTPTDGVANKYRITSWGIKLSCTLPPLSAQGMCHVRLYSNQSGANFTTINVTDDACEELIDIPIARLVEEDLFVIPMPIGLEARQYRTLNASGTFANYQNIGWQQVVIGITGGAASSSEVLKAYIYVNAELIPGEGASQAVYAMAPPPDSPSVRQGSSNVLESIGNFVSGAADKVEKIFESKAFQIVGAGVAAYLGYPAAAGAMVVSSAGSSRRNARIVD
jgi:hypothetical protein